MLRQSPYEGILEQYPVKTGLNFVMRWLPPDFSASSKSGAGRSLATLEQLPNGMIALRL